MKEWRESKRITKQYQKTNLDINIYRNVYVFLFSKRKRKLEIIYSLVI